MDEDYEQTLAMISEGHVYRVPPRTSASGYKASEFGDLTKPLFTGRVVVTSKGPLCIIKIIGEDGKVFATCEFAEADANKCVQRVTDSSRYFVLAISDGSGRKAHIGLGFQERGDAFDFNLAMQDHLKYLRHDKQADESQKRAESQPAQDFSLKSGQTITISMKKKPPAEDAPDAGNAGRRSRPSAGGLGGGLLPPPPGGVTRKPQRQQQQPQPQQQQQQQPLQQQQAPSSDPFASMFGTAPTQPQAQQPSFSSSPFTTTNTAPASSAADDLFGDFASSTTSNTKNDGWDAFA
eukprot:TRINITY_DN1950_c1_g2_i1.p1 TRINITY_DN1950_c1_g2~~TRINITY_DN1950_c1_g2_i1.p1  ORF type:complete len:304 (+),score=95.90 TRINITY_DN1950_c1_g2_i1:35-913(+)